jgi:alkanesulfonate monooxygenase SsuD/methylene tetrahydromethanopterin reductase-like flavin-dependent oxidoreductase (luciferase family)
MFHIGDVLTAPLGDGLGGVGMDYPDLGQDYRQGPLLGSPNKLKFAVFCANNQRGTTISHAEEALHITWPETVRVAKAADAAGIEALIPLARWKAVKHTVQEYERVFETFTWAAGIAAATERAQIFSTVHIPLVHPVMAAKAAATIDNISGGRYGLNLVAGWNSHDFAMFGYVQREHDDRYAAAAEWVDFVERAWSTKAPFDFAGSTYKGTGVISEPKPIQAPRPVLMSAGFSPAGQKFARKYADLNFCALQSIEDAAPIVAKAKQAAWEEHRRNVLVFAGGWIVCRDTEKEAREYADHVIREQGDLAVAEAELGEMMPNSHSIRGLAKQGLVERMMAGFFGLPFVGTPEQIVSRLKQASDAGLDGLAISWVDYHLGLQQYRDKLLPLMIEAGLRVR